jgi:hypothetical protein
MVSMPPVPQHGSWTVTMGRSRPSFSSSSFQQQPDHEVDDVAGREVLARVLVQRLVELPDQLLEDRPHHGVRDPVRVEVDLRELLHDLEEEPGLVELRDRVVEVELLDHLPHVRAERLDVRAEVVGDVLRVVHQPLEGVERRVVEGVAGGLPEEVVRVVELAFVLAVGLEDLLLRGLQDLVDAAEDGQREDDVLVLAALEGVADQVGDGPEEGGDLGVGHGLRTNVSSLLLS